MNEVYIIDNNNLLLSLNTEEGKELKVLDMKSNVLRSLDIPHDYEKAKLYNGIIYVLKNDDDVYSLIRYNIQN